MCVYRFKIFLTEDKFCSFIFSFCIIVQIARFSIFQFTEVAMDEYFNEYHK